MPHRPRIRRNAELSYLCDRLVARLYLLVGRRQNRSQKGRVGSHSTSAPSYAVARQPVGSSFRGSRWTFRWRYSAGDCDLQKRIDLSRAQQGSRSDQSEGLSNFRRTKGGSKILKKVDSKQRTAPGRSHAEVDGRFFALKARNKIARGKRVSRATPGSVNLEFAL